MHGLRKRLLKVLVCGDYKLLKGPLMKTKLWMLTVAVACTFSGNAMSMTKEEYKVQKDQIGRAHV